ncbi:MAG: hypothetical protein ABL908_01000 [Hyphomicrobium sp.]
MSKMTGRAVNGVFLSEAWAENSTYQAAEGATSLPTDFGGA